MNWPGFVFGASATAALIGAALAVLLPRQRDAAAGLALAAFGVAGMLLAVGSDFLALTVALVLGVAVPAAMRAVYDAMPAAPRSSIRPSRVAGSVVLGAACFALLAWVALRGDWREAAGPRETAAAWIGFRLLTDYLLALLLGATALLVAAIAAVALSRATRPSLAEPPGSPREAP